jgi:hypothetical protein
MIQVCWDSIVGRCTAQASIHIAAKQQFLVREAHFTCQNVCSLLDDFMAMNSTMMSITYKCLEIYQVNGYGPI